MASYSPIKFIEQALQATGPFALSYADPDQKWLIRKHLISLLHVFPNFELSTDTFNHNNGTTVHLLCLHGSIHLRHPTLQLPSVPLTIWVHENYPLTPPSVFVNPNSFPIRTNHPFVDASGFTNSTYIETWEHPRCNLLKLIRKLVKVFTYDHPFVHTFSIPSRSLSVSKTEALDRLTANLHYDMLALQAKAEEDIENLTKLQTQMAKRSDSAKTIIREHEIEREKLNHKARKLEDDANVMTNWVKTNYPKMIEAMTGNLSVEEIFGMEDEAKKEAVESSAADEAIEDVIGVLEEALESGDLEIGTYLRQVRILGREQFFHRERIRQVFIP